MLGIHRGMVAGALVLAAIAGAARAQEKPEQPATPAEGARPARPVSIPARFKVGDKVELVLTISKEKRKGSGTPTRGTSTTGVTIEVLGVDEQKNTRLAWTMGDVELPEGAEKGAAGATARAVAEAVRGMRLEFIIDADGAIGEMVNWEEVSAKVMKAVELVLAEQRKVGGVPEEAIEAARKTVEQIYGDRETAERLLLKDAYIYFEPFGYELEDDGEQVMEIELPNMMGGPPLPAESRITFTGHEPGGATIEMRIVQRCTEGAQAALVETMKQLAENAGRPIPDDAEAKLQAENFSLEMDYSYVYDTARGWVRTARWVQRAKFGDMRQTETRTLRMKEEPKPRATP